MSSQNHAERFAVGQGRGHSLAQGERPGQNRMTEWQEPLAKSFRESEAFVGEDSRNEAGRQLEPEIDEV